MPHLSKGTKGRQARSGGDGERWGSDRGSRVSLNKQIALVLIRLQEDMQNVLQRLHKLETLTASQAKFSLQTSHQPSSQKTKLKKWPFTLLGLDDLRDGLEMSGIHKKISVLMLTFLFCPVVWFIYINSLCTTQMVTFSRLILLILEKSVSTRF